MADLITIRVGDHFEKEYHVTDSMVEDFAKVSGDVNPIHLDSSYAEKTIFKKKISHGMLIGSFISAILGNNFPGVGTIYISQSFDFKAPVFVDEKIKIRIEAIEFIKSNRLKLATQCYNQEGKIVLDGIAVVMNQNLSKVE